MRLIKLTSDDTRDVLYINAEKIDVFCASAYGGTKVVIGNEPYYVGESPQMVARMLGLEGDI